MFIMFIGVSCGEKGVRCSNVSYVHWRLLWRERSALFECFLCLLASPVERKECVVRMFPMFIGVSCGEKGVRCSNVSYVYWRLLLRERSALFECFLCLLASPVERKEFVVRMFPMFIGVSCGEKGVRCSNVSYVYWRLLLRERSALFECFLCLLASPVERKEFVVRMFPMFIGVSCGEKGVRCSNVSYVYWRLLWRERSWLFECFLCLLASPMIDLVGCLILVGFCFEYPLTSRN